MVVVVVAVVVVGKCEKTQPLRVEVEVVSSKVCWMDFAQISKLYLCTCQLANQSLRNLGRYLSNCPD